MYVIQFTTGLVYKKSTHQSYFYQLKCLHIGYDSSVYLLKNLQLNNWIIITEALGNLLYKEIVDFADNIFIRFNRILKFAFVHRMSDDICLCRYDWIVTILASN